MKHLTEISELREQIEDVGASLRHLGSILKAIQDADYLSGDMTFDKRNQLGNLLGAAHTLFDQSKDALEKSESAAGKLEQRVERVPGGADAVIAARTN